MAAGIVTAAVKPKRLPRPKRPKRKSTEPWPPLHMQLPDAQTLERLSQAEPLEGDERLAAENVDADGRQP